MSVAVVDNTAKQVSAGKRHSGRWQPGQSGNPKGPPLKPEAIILREALVAAKNKKGKHLIEHAVELAYDNHDIMIAILKKILPDKLDMTQHIDEHDAITNVKLLRNRLCALIGVSPAGEKDGSLSAN